MVSLTIFGIIALILIAAPFFITFTENDKKNHLPAILFIAGFVSLVIGVASYPYANLWQKGLAGQAQLKQAEWNRQIKVRESEAFLASAKNYAAAEVERAKGAAEANEIIADGLGGPGGYLRYLFIEGLKTAHENGNQIIYIPTEAGLPILEANRFNEVQP